MCDFLSSCLEKYGGFWKRQLSVGGGCRENGQVNFGLCIYKEKNTSCGSVLPASGGNGFGAGSTSRRSTAAL